MDIAGWLRGLGLQDYERAFRDNHVSADVLPRLSAEDLKEIGVISVGHRRMMLDAIAVLHAASVPPDESVVSQPAAPERPDRTGPAIPEVGRRQLTVLFCDLVGSTALSARLDPEEMGDVLRAYHACCAEVIARFDGHVAKYLGDGVLAYFGYPHAHEDDAERAVYAGLGLVEAITKLQPRGDLALEGRVAIATGLVVVGELIGSGEAQERAVVGETPNLAARLQALAASNSVVISNSTRQLVSGLFNLADLGQHELKGFEPARAWRVLGPSTAENRFDARHETSLTPLVGREHEFGLLLDRWGRAKEGEGQVVLLSGEPGIGKSRLLRALRERLDAEPYTALSHYCSPYHTNSALFPAAGLLERASGLRRDERPEQQLDRLEALLALAVENVDEVAPLLADLLSIPTGDRYPPLDLTPQRKKERTLEVLVDQLAGLAARQPVLVLYEDVHWMDPSTLELLGLVVDRVQHWPVLVIITFRPDFQSSWTGYPHITTLTLNRLGRRQGTEIIRQVTGGKPIPAQVMEQILAKTDGVPLFVEELTKAVLESALLIDAGERYELAGPLPPLAIPSTLHDSLMARLDRLAPVKEVVQIGAVIGREFSYELLAAVVPLRENQLRDALAQLVEAELVFGRGVPPKASYIFKHALVQDAAYQSLLRSKRQQLHARILQVMEERFPEQVEAQPELAAHHSTEAGLLEKAVDYWHKAGQEAILSSATVEAVAHLTSALKLLCDVAEGPERCQKEIELQVTLGGAMLVAKGWASPEMGQAYARARELCRELRGNTPRLFPALYGLVAFHQNRAELDAALEVAEEFLVSAGAKEDTAAKFLGHRVASNVFMYRGRFDAARPHLERVVAEYNPLQHSFPMYVPIDSGVNCRSFLAWRLLFQGYPDRALLESREALAAASELGHLHTLAFAQHLNCLFHQVRGDRAVVEERAAALMAFATEQAFPHIRATSTIFYGWAIAARGEIAAGVSEMRRGLAAKQATGAQLKVPYYLGLLAETYNLADKASEGVSLLADALARVERTQERWFEPELHRLAGEVRLRLSEPDRVGAEACFQRAVQIAQEQEAKLWELRAVMSLARSWRDQGKRREAYDMLAAIYAWFTEGLDTQDLQKAKALLDTLT